MSKGRPAAHFPADYDDKVIMAFQALKAGDADEDQQRRVLDWLIVHAAGTYELSFRSEREGGERETAFAEGRRFVGLQVVKMINMPPAMVAQLRKQNA